MFHIIPDDTGSSALWVAQRVPDNHITIVANQFVIGEIVPDSPDFIYSDNIFSVAERNGFWDPSQVRQLTICKTVVMLYITALKCLSYFFICVTVAKAFITVLNLSP